VIFISNQVEIRGKIEGKFDSDRQKGGENNSITASNCGVG
jgi:hypothetical protein